MSEWKVLIADDEPKLRRGLHARIERLGLPLTVCGEAEDGEMALEAAERLRPDILLVDINMPFMNGLDFIEALRRTRTDAKIIVVTGYEEFAYARRALSMNVHAYLLKPIESDELQHSLETAIEQLELAREKDRHFEWAIAQIGRRREFLREEFLRDAVSGRLEADEIRDFRVYFDFPAAVRLMLMVIVTRSVREDDQPWQHLLLQYVMEDTLSRLKAECRYACLFQDDRGNLLLLYDADEAADARVASEVCDALMREFGLKAQVATQAVPSLTQLSRAYDAVLEQVLGSIRLSPVVEAARRYIAAHYGEAELGLGDVADALGLNATYLSRLMKQELGMSFSKFLTNLRISEAVRLMRDPDLRVREVAERVGYSAASYFSAAFKKVLGVSPAEYREEGQNG